MEKGLPWVLLTGSVREPELVKNKLRFISSLIEKGLVENFVFSTWQGELEKDVEVYKLLTAINGIVVLSEIPTIKTMGSFLHQILQLENGLAVIPDDVFVLKARTDKCEAQDGFIESDIETLLYSKQYQQPCTYQQGNILQYKIGTLEKDTNLSLFFPILFFFLDRWYIGYKHDLERFINYRILDSDYFGLIPEQIIFANLFMSNWTVIKQFFRAVCQDECILRMLREPLGEEQLRQLADYLYNSSLFIDAFLAERFILSEFFYDVPTQTSIPLNTKFRGVELNIDNRIYFAVNPNLLKLFPTEEINALRDYLQNKFLVRSHTQQQKIVQNKLTVYQINKVPLRYLKID